MLEQPDVIKTLIRQFPPLLVRKIQNFIIDNRTGNIEIHIRDGKIVGATAKEQLDLKR